MADTNSSLLLASHNETITGSLATPNSHLVWVYGLLLVTGINLCSLLGIAINPLSKKRWYRGLLLFMVALAVGVLAGSSLLFLFSGALEIDKMEWEFRQKYIVKVTIVLTSIFVFFNFEQLLKLLLATLVSRRKAKAQAEKQCPCRQQSLVAKDKNSKIPETLTSMVPLPVQCTCDADKKGADVETTAFQSVDNAVVVDDSAFNLESLPVSSVSHHHPHTRVAQATSVSLDIPDDALDKCLEDIIDDPPVRLREKSPDVGRRMPNGNGDVKGPMVVNTTTTVSESSVRRRRRTDSGVSAIAATSLSHVQPVAWMVIFGDGIHNFVDGLSIGAGMARSFPEGLSIALAVLAEELPHELGDLAVLLRAGLPLRRALLLNFLSACLCYIGFAIGAVVGEFPYASAVIYAMAAGLFLYISLTDLLPELSPESNPEGNGHGHSHDVSGNSNSNSAAVVDSNTGVKRSDSTVSASKPAAPLRRLCTHLVIADAGMIVGYTLMAILAVYSDDIRVSMEETPDSPMFGNSTSLHA